LPARSGREALFAYFIIVHNCKRVSDAAAVERCSLSHTNVRTIEDPHEIAITDDESDPFEKRYGTSAVKIFALFPHGRVVKFVQEPAGKVKITTRLDRDLVDHFLARADELGARPGITLINDTLRQSIEAPSLEAWFGGQSARN
jgi:uncharacterized protein (DUF4415 family)